MVKLDEPIVQTVGLTKTFRDFWHREKVCAVRDLDLSVMPHQVFGLLGPNGSGKSTTIKMVLGLLYPSKGYIRVFGKPPTDVSIKARLGFLPEESYLYPFLNARETLDYYGRLFRQPRIERRKRVDMLLEMVGLAAVASRRVGEYSKGMQRRIGLAQALINDPDLLILDEPTSGMDPLGTRQFKDLILELGRRGKTVILSSHLLADVEDVCDRVVILYGGRNRAEGGVGDLLRQHGLTQIIAERLDEPTIEKIRRIIQSEHGKSVLEVTSPKDRLETVFLRIVEQARTERISTGGAVATGEVAEFLRASDEEGHAIIDRLMTVEPTAAPAAVEPVLASPRPEQAAQAVIEELSAAPSRGGEAASPAEEPAPPPAAEEADRSVIDSLLAQPHEGESKE